MEKGSVKAKAARQQKTDMRPPWRAKAAIVTGSGGIGLGIAKAFAKNGASGFAQCDWVDGSEIERTRRGARRRRHDVVVRYHAANMQNLAEIADAIDYKSP